MEGNIEEKPEPNMDQIINNIQIELVVYVELVAIATKSFKPIQHVVKSIQIENPLFLIFQLVPVFGHSTKTLRQITMFLGQVVQNATT
jgi:hypothetical protein